MGVDNSTIMDIKYMGKLILSGTSRRLITQQPTSGHKELDVMLA
jgi:hypothetical protein